MAVVIVVIVDILADVIVSIELVVDKQVDEGVQNTCVEVAKPVETSIRTLFWRCAQGSNQPIKVHVGRPKKNR